MEVDPKTGRRKPVSRKWLFLALSLAAGGAAGWASLHVAGLDFHRSAMAGIFTSAALLWMTEALPLFATSLLVLALEIILLANPGGWAFLEAQQASTLNYKQVIGFATDPVLMLFFGGFLLARAAIKTGVDHAMAGWLLRPFGTGPRGLLAGILGVTALFSMFMSNTATTAMMIALVAPILKRVGPRDPFRKAIVLGVAFAANIGGVGTPIGSPPNAVASGYLAKAGHTVHFMDWMLVAMPILLACLGALGLVLWFLYRPEQGDLRIHLDAGSIDTRGWMVVGTFVVTVLLWLTDFWHGLPASVVALLPAVLLTASSILDRSDLNGLEWNVLILIAGGIALGSGIASTGLDQDLVRWLPIGSGTGALAVMLILMTGTWVLSIFMSNTAASNLILPIGISAAVSMGQPGWVTSIGLAIAFSASLAMVLPISTPPNAIAYATQEFETRDMARMGLMIGMGGILLVALLVHALSSAVLGG